jgi:SAM-dependent methyltransferase
MSEWNGYLLEDYKYDFRPGSLVLDVGCDYGRQMEGLNQRGCSTIGIDVNATALSDCRRNGLCVVKARAEQIPLASACLDGIICKVVLSYSEEDKVIREIGRLLRPGAKCYLVSHGAGYYLRCLLFAAGWKDRMYALRTLVNTWLWAATGRRFPRFLGDTIYQSHQRLAEYFRENGLALCGETPCKHFLGFPVFIYQMIEKTAQTVAPTDASELRPPPTGHC